MKLSIALMFGCSIMILGNDLQAQMTSWEVAQHPEFLRPQWEHVFNVSFVDSLNGWAITHGVDGPDDKLIEMTRILYTIDGGKNWKVRYQDSQIMYFSVDFVNKNYGWMSGSGRIRYTTNGGKHWSSSFFSQILFYDGLDICFSDTLNGWVVCAGGKIYHSSDGGKSWRAQQSGTEAWLTNIEMLNENLGWVVGGVFAGVILNTTNGGKTWSRQWSDPSFELSGLHVIDSLEVWAAGTNNLLMHTIDGGLTWERKRVWGPGAKLFGIDFLNPQYGWVVGEAGFIAYTFDGGETWIPDSSGTNAWLTDVAFLDSEKVCIVGNEATFLYHTGPVVPMITSSPETLAITNETYVYSIEAHASPRSHYTLINGPQKIRLNPITGFLYWTPTRDDTGRHQITVRAENPAGIDEQSYSLHVIYRNHPPIFNYLFPQQDSIYVALRDTVRFLASAYNLDFDTLVYKWEINGVTVPDSIVYPPWERRLLHATTFVPDSVRDYSVKLSIWDHADTTMHIWHVFVAPILGVADARSELLPKFAALLQNYPNPFNPETVIEYQLPRASEVEISIFNLQGQKVVTLEAGHRTAGSYKIIWNGTDEFARPVTSGIYLYKLKVGKFVVVKKMLVMR